MESPELHYKYRGLWSPHIKVLFELLMESESHDLMVELIGCLANMTLLDIPANSNWPKLLREFNVINFLNKLLNPGLAQNDLILEIVMLLAAISSDAAACSLITSSSLLGTLYQLFKEKSESDAEFTLQILNCFHKLLLHPTAKEEVMYSTRMVVDIIDCLTHRSVVIRSKAEKMSEIGTLHISLAVLPFFTFILMALILRILRVCILVW